MEKKTGPSLNMAAFGSRSFDGCKTILRLFAHYSLIGILILSAGCNPSSSTVNYNQTAQPDGDVSQRETILMGGGGGGTGDGGGGQGVYCSDDVSDKNLKGKLLVRDIYEAIKNHNRSIPKAKLEGNGTIEVEDTSIDYLVSALKLYFGPASVNLDFVNAKYWNNFAQSISFSAENSNIHPSQDANSPLALPKGCQIVQIAYWDESSGPIDNGTLYVDKKRWIQLDQFNKIALLAHEFFFKQARKAGYKNSDFVRYKVGQLLSDTGLSPMFQNWTPSKEQRVKDSLPNEKDGFKFCQGTTEDDPSAKLQMYQYLGSDKMQHLVIPLMTSSKLSISELQAPHVRFSENAPNTSLITDMWTPATYLSQDLTQNIEINGILNRTLKARFRYADSGTLTKKIGKVFRRDLERRLSKLVDNEYSDTKWIVPTQIGSRPLNITLHNQFAKFKKPVDDMKSREDLILAVNKKITSILTDVPSINSTGYDELAVTAVLFLNKEIDQMIIDGKYDKSFPSWTEELKKLNSKIQNTEFRGIHSFKVDSEFDLNSNLVIGLPNALYDLKANIYSAEYLERQGINPYKNYSDKDLGITSTKEGTISFQQGQEQITFTLHCEDYIDVYRNRTKKTEYQDEHWFLQNESVKLVFDQKSFNDYTRKSSLDLTTGFLKFLTSGKEVRKSNIESSCEEYNHDPILCYDLNSFFSDMKMEDEIQASYCDGHQGVFSGSENPSTCAILKLKKSEQKYLVVFYFPKKVNDSQDEAADSNKRTAKYPEPDFNEKPYIQYILRVPYAPKD